MIVLDKYWSQEDIDLLARKYGPCGPINTHKLTIEVTVDRSYFV